ncbi:MAG: Ig-like domain-containing protein [Verrucomicrobiota bacterium]
MNSESKGVLPYRHTTREYIQCAKKQLAISSLLGFLLAAPMPGRSQTLDSFNPGANDLVENIAVLSGGKILVSGSFTTLGGQSVTWGFGKLNVDGSRDPFFFPGASPAHLVMQPEGKILQLVNGQIKRLNADGSTDAAFNSQWAGTDTYSVLTMAAQPDGKILVGGEFTTLAGQPRLCIGRFNADGSLDGTFHPSTNWSINGPSVFSLAVLPTGKILASGAFPTPDGKGIKYFARFNADGSVDSTFSLSVNSFASAMVVQPDGKVLLGGTFTKLNGIRYQPALGVIRLNANGTLDTTFKVGIDGGSYQGAQASWVSSLALQPDGKILVGGNFATLGGQARANLGRLNSSIKIAKPTLAIAEPKIGQRVSNSLFTVKGTASGSAAITGVQFQLNNGTWQPATGTTTWEATLPLTMRSNTVKAYATDAVGNYSATSSVSFLYIASDTLTVWTNGNGTIKGSYNGKLLELGQSYTMTAVPGTGYLFSNWVNGAGAVLTNGPALKFTMESNLTLVANFVPNPFIPIAGNYSGLFSDTNGVAVSNAGSFTISVTPAGTFTAQVQQGAKSYPLSGQFALDGTWQTASIKGAAGWNATLQIDLHSGSAITGRIGNGTWTAEIYVLRAAYSKLNPAPQAGQYTLVITSNGGSTNLPGGYGALAVSVSPTGGVTVNGAMGDGEPVTASTVVSKTGQWPLYSALYGKTGMVIGWLNFTNNTDLGGVVSWSKPAQPKAKMYTTGWPCEVCNAVGSSFTNLPQILNWTNGTIILEGGNLAESVTNGIAIGAGNKVTGTNGLKLTLTTTGIKAGLFTGSVGIPGTKTTRTINGALLQNQNAGYGWFLGTNLAGSVIINAE